MTTSPIWIKCGYWPRPEVPRVPSDTMIFNAWTNHSFGLLQVHEAAEAFSNLWGEIYRKMVARGSVTRRLYPVCQLFDEEILKATKLRQKSFVFGFLQKIRKPPADCSISRLQQLLSPERNHRGTRIPSLILFPTDEIAATNQPEQNESQDTNDTNGTTGSHSTRSDRDGPGPVIPEKIPLPPGVYSATARLAEDNAEEGFSFILPFVLKLCPGLSKSDGRPLLKGRNDDLYQHGYKPFGGHRFRPQRLIKLLEIWTMMVRDGHWNVDRNGVAGGIDVFRQADDPQFANLYRIEADW
ncbi:hypothetical protein DL98DRAFT_576132 [Cadophora sp. DSE1049]|nr:hypothetical protein DL98DRAFT_576132 [Cadophora sp. DSE1049]